MSEPRAVPQRRIALIHPAAPAASAFDRLGRSSIPPLGLLYLAAALEQAGHSVRVFDLALPRHDRQLLAELRSFAPDLVGLGTLAPAYDQVRALAERLRTALPAATLIAGGADATTRTDLYQPLFDTVFVGEAEQTLVDYCASAEPPAQRMIRSTARVVPDEAPFPARHLLPLKEYHGGPAYKRRRHSTSIFTHRGCPYHCAFCEKGVHDGPIRLRSAGSIFAEIGEIRRVHGIHDLRFVDDVLLCNHVVVRELCELVLRAGERFSWMCCGRVDLLDDGLLRLMHRAGCYRLELGLESGSERVLAQVDKKITVAQAIDAVRRTRRMGLEVIANFILGLPGETREEMEHTVRFSRAARPDFAIYFVFTPFAGAPISRQLGLRWGDAPSFRAPSPHYLVPTAEVEALAERAYSRFYFRPRTIARRLWSLRSPYLAWEFARLAFTHLWRRLSPAGGNPNRQSAG